jgi:hypothetical protein
MHKIVMNADEKAWEEYRLHQRDVLHQCFEDAHLMIKRMQSLHPEEELRLVVQLLFEKRCQPWKYYRDERRALVRN